MRADEAPDPKSVKAYFLGDGPDRGSPKRSKQEAAEGGDSVDLRRAGLGRVSYHSSKQANASAE